MTNERSAALLREFVVRRLVSQVASVLGGAHGELRVELAVAHLLGVALLRYALRVEPLASADPADLVWWVTPSLNRYVGADGSTAEEDHGVRGGRGRRGRTRPRSQ